MSKKSRRKRARRANNIPRPVERKHEIMSYPVYPKDEVLGEQPLYFIPWEMRKVWLEQGAIRAINDGTAVRLMLNLPPKPQVSVTTQGLSDGVVAKLPYAIEILRAWTPRHRLAA